MNKANLEKKLDILDSLTPAKEAFFSKRTAKALVINLSEESFQAWDIPQVFLDAYVSGPALACRLWSWFVGPDLENPSSYESDNPIIFTSSAVTNMKVPGGESLGYAFRSPVTKTLVTGTVTNTIGMRLDSLGYAALVVLGRFRRPSLISIQKSGVTFNTSETFIGYTVSQIEAYIGVKPMTTILSIGPAGEQKVPFATVICEGGPISRGGLGTVFGFKNIKAISLTGFSAEVKGETKETEDAEKAASIEKLRRICEESFHCIQMRSSGSACLISNANRYGWAPVSNFRRRTDPRLFHLSGEEVTRRYGKEHVGCINCPVLCKHLSSDGFVLPDYQALLMLGSNVECFDVNSIMVRLALCLDMGLDPISTGNVLGWALQAKEVGLFTALESDFSFAKNDCVLPLIEMIAKRVGPGEPLSFGVKALGQAYEDSSFAYEIRGLECGPYDYRGAFSQALSDVMGLNFHNQFEISSELCNKDPALWAVFNEKLSLGLSSFGILPSLIVPVLADNHKFLNIASKTIPSSAINMLEPKLFAEVLSSSLKVPVSDEDILSLGDLCWMLIYEINQALGFNMLEDSFEALPNHFSVDPESNSKKQTIVPIFDLVQRYCLLRKKGIATKLSKLNREST